MKKVGNKKGNENANRKKRKNPRRDFGNVVHHKRRVTRDISKQGGFIKKDEWAKDMTLLPIGSDIDFSLDFINTDDYIDVTGTVVHHGNNEDGMGILFKRIDAGQRSLSGCLYQIICKNKPQG